VPVAETQAGKGALPWDHPLQQVRSRHRFPAANALARDADVVLAIGTRLQDITTGRHSMFGAAKLVALTSIRSTRSNGAAQNCAPTAASTRCVVERVVGLARRSAWTRRAEEARTAGAGISPASRATATWRFRTRAT